MLVIRLNIIHLRRENKLPFLAYKKGFEIIFKAFFISMCFDLFRT